MNATIWHNPRCGTSRATLALLEEAGADITVVEYLKEPPTASELSRLYGLAGLTPRDGLRRSEPSAEELGEADAAVVLAAMALMPALIQRPLVETAKGVRLCRPAERVMEIL